MTQNEVQTEEDSTIDEALAVLVSVYIASLIHSALSIRIASSITALDMLNKARSAAKLKPVSIKLSEMVRGSTEAIKSYAAMLKEKGGSMVVEDDIKIFNPWLNDLTTETKIQLQDIFNKSKTESWSSAKIKEELGKIEDFGKNVRAKTAAFCETRVQQDEATRKLWSYGELKMCQWHTMEDSRVRPKHVERNHRVYKVNEAPSLGEPNCRCYLSPYIVKDNWSPDYTAKERGYHPKQIKIQDSIIQKIVREETGIPASKVAPISSKIKPDKKLSKTLIRTQEDVEKVIRGKEAGIRNRTTEKVFIFDKNGKVILEKEGTETRIEFTDAEAKLFRGNVHTHNHPNGSSFSLNDWRTACYGNAKELRATTTGKTFSLSKTDGSNFTESEFEKIETEYNKHRQTAILEYRKLIQNNEMDIDKASYMASHFTNLRTANSLDGIKYTVIRE